MPPSTASSETSYMEIRLSSSTHNTISHCLTDTFKALAMELYQDALPEPLAHYVMGLECPDPEEAFFHFGAAASAEERDVGAFFQLAQCYAAGRGVNRSLKKATS